MQSSLGLLLALIVGAGASWPPAGELDWASEYVAEAPPDASVPYWAGDPGPGTSPALEEDGLRIVDASSETGSLCRYHRGWRIDPDAGGAVEAVIKVIDNDGKAGVGFMLADGVHEAHLTLYPDRIDINFGQIEVPFDTTGRFHTYRLATRGQDLLLWVDGEQVVDGEGQHNHEAHAGRCKVSFGSGSSTAKSEAVYARVSYLPFGERALPKRLEGARDVTIYKKPGVYACFPSLYRLDDGTLVTHFGTRVRRSHMDPAGGTADYQSTDGGETWTPVDGKRPLNPALRREDGSWVRADAYGWRHVPEARRGEFEAQDVTVRTVREGVVAYLQGAYAAYSGDGEEWRKEPLQLPAHRSLMTYHRVDYDSLSPGLRVVSIYGALKEDPKNWGRSFLLRSADDGDTWWFLPLAAEPGKQVRLNETALAQNAEGGLVAMIRSEPPAGGHLYTTMSHDRGITWEPVRRTGIWGYPAHLLLLDDGRLLCTYGYRRGAMGVRAVISPDGGQTWNLEDELILRCDGLGNGSDLGYPISIETGPGKVFTIYYITTDDGITHIAGTHWVVPG